MQNTAYYISILIILFSMHVQHDTKGLKQKPVQKAPLHKHYYSRMAQNCGTKKTTLSARTHFVLFHPPTKIKWLKMCNHFGTICFRPVIPNLQKRIHIGVFLMMSEEWMDRERHQLTLECTLFFFDYRIIIIDELAMLSWAASTKMHRLHCNIIINCISGSIFNLP